MNFICPRMALAISVVVAVVAVDPWRGHEERQESSLEGEVGGEVSAEEAVAQAEGGVEFRSRVWMACGRG